MNVDVPNEAAAPIGDGEVTRWACTEEAPDAAPVPLAESIAIAGDVNHRPSLRTPGTIRALLALAVGSAAFAAVLGLRGSAGLALAFVGLAAIFACLAVVLELAAIPSIRAWFRCKYCSWGVETHENALRDSAWPSLSSGDDNSAAQRTPQPPLARPRS